MHRTLRRAGVLAALAVPALGAGVAAADTTVAADPTAQNVTTYGSTSAWSRKAGDGTYHLVVSQAGQVADAPVPASGEPYDPDLGPTKANGRTIVYARDGDLYRYDVGAAAEQKLTALSSDAPEVAPSFFKDAIAFSRTSGPKPGLYLSRPGRGLKRLFRKPAAETDLAATRVVGRFGERAHRSSACSTTAATTSASWRGRRPSSASPARHCRASTPTGCGSAPRSPASRRSASTPTEG
jgi:hypothetical protein